MGDTDSRQELAHFLRTRRAQLSPTDVGIRSVGRRRTPGLRREEVSHLSGVSVTWYTWLEQGRDINVSKDVLAAIARTLRLDRAETAHLAVLAGQGSHAADMQNRVERPPESLRTLLQAITPNPAYTISSLWDIVAWNAAYEALFADISSVSDADRNLLWMVFTVPSVRELLADWEVEAQRLMAQFRAESGPLLAEHSFRALVDRLQDESPEFRTWWSRHDVATFSSRRREFNHPVVGRLILDHHKLVLAEHPDLRIIVYTPTGDQKSEHALARLIDSVDTP